MDKKEQTRLRVERYRNKQKSVTETPKAQVKSKVTESHKKEVTRKRVRRYREEHPDYYKAELEARRRTGACEVCGYSLTIDLHHEGQEREEHLLCPNCHALITRGLATLEELNGSNKGTEESIPERVYA